MEKEVFIYTLRHPITKEIRYIGKTVKSLQKRLNNHIFESKELKCHRHKWVNSILQIGLKPEIELIDIVKIDNWQFWESYWIEQFKYWGFNLVNGTAGGDGCDWTNKKHSNESKEKMSIAKIGKSTWNKNKKLTKEHIKKLSEAHLGKKISTKSIDKRSETNRIPVALIDSKNNIIKVFKGISEATREFGLKYNQINQIIKSGIPSKRKGYLFKYL